MYNSILGVTTQGKLCKDDSKGQGIPTENRRKIERGLGILPYGNLTTQTIGKCGGFRLCHDTGSAC